MTLKKHVVLGVHITDRTHHVEAVQKAFTCFGCSIRTRLGLHEADAAYCSPNGLILLEMIDEAKADELTQALQPIEGVEVQRMVFDHP